MATSEKKRVSPAGKIRIWHCAAVLHMQVFKKCISLLYILILETYSKFAWKNNFSVFASRRQARALATCLPCQEHVYITTDESFRFPGHNSQFDEMPCKLDSTENLRSFEKYTQPHL